MKRLYYLEDCNGEIIRYCNTLRQAKESLICMLGAYSETDLRIVALKSPKGFQYGEGYHEYYLKFTDGVFKRGGAE